MSRSITETILDRLRCGHPNLLFNLWLLFFDETPLTGNYCIRHRTSHNILCLELYSKCNTRAWNPVHTRIVNTSVACTGLYFAPKRFFALEARESLARDSRARVSRAFDARESRGPWRGFAGCSSKSGWGRTTLTLFREVSSIPIVG
ncbi:unnamed protein product [Chondrus crispus]|uniref:Uncharacterized protein n=1 Tax=Chondrus crispus TaxID=2769 RepID=R7QP39_CHOCR|nr:unnamed protein product [Chondrus crispus]CDF40267.1 unnamed protein product [Chondrus crispus]|eukprot:XP_005710561.1 unnamed protein product [Chondrus crispus]